MKWDRPLSGTPCFAKEFENGLLSHSRGQKKTRKNDFSKSLWKRVCVLWRFSLDRQGVVEDFEKFWFLLRGNGGLHVDLKVSHSKVIVPLFSRNFQNFVSSLTSRKFELDKNQNFWRQKKWFFINLSHFEAWKWIVEPREPFFLRCPTHGSFTLR